MRHQHPTYAAMIRSLDDSIGRLRTCIKELGEDDNTIFIFTSDNGGYLGTSAFDGRETPITSNWPLRSGKGTCYEGGLRVPLIIDWPAINRTGECDQPVVLMDLFQTLTSVLPETSTSEIPDGMNLLPLLRDGDAKLDRDALYFHYPHYYHAPPSTPVGAVRAGRWKLLEFFEDQQLELYDLQNDPSETKNVVAEHPDETTRLLKQLHAWRVETDAAMPTLNPSWNEAVR